MVSIWSTELQKVITSRNVHIGIFVPLEVVVVDASQLLDPDFPVFIRHKTIVVAVVFLLYEKVVLVYDTGVFQTVASWY